MSHVTYKHGPTIAVHRDGCGHLGKHDPARYARARRERNDPDYDFHPGYEDALRFAHEQGRRVVKRCSTCL